VGIAIDARARQILVADAGNARIQRFDAELRPVAEYAIKEWEDLAPSNKPDLAVLPDGRLLVSDPAHGRVLLVGTDGAVAATLSDAGGEALAAPRGIAYDEAGGFVFVSEGTAGRVRRFPLSDFALR
jgi:sugar lactone lactonase YvrE